MTFSDIWRAIRDTWMYPIAMINGATIVVGTVIVALILLGCGYYVSRRLSRAAGALLMRRAGVDAGAAAAVETLTFYILFVGFGVTALRLVNFPLAALTIVGGALAIGIGFGSQNIMNNFISGLILLVERPIRVNDLVEVERTYGTVEHIGARSTRIRAVDNAHIIVPNSFFLQHNVVNFTLSDDVLGTHVSLGVAYGSPTRKVEQLIGQALNEHAEVLKSPPPRVLFAEFGENALNFEAFFWVRVRTIMDRRRIESDVRYRIDELFRESGVVVAFPQRDVHLDSGRPVDVRLVPGTPRDHRLS
jgi:potassium-dependent mechanosensitive channel